MKFLNKLLIDDFVLNEISFKEFFQENQRYSNIWVNPTLLKTIADLSKTEVYILTIEQNSSLVAYFPLFYKRHLVFNICINPYLYFYGKICFTFDPKKRIQDNKYRELLITEAIAKYLGKKYYKISINLEYSHSDMRGFTWNHLRVTPYYTLFIDLLNGCNEEDYSLSRRNGIKKAHKIQFTIKSDILYPDFKRLLLATFERKSYNINDKIDYFYNFMKQMEDENLVEIFACSIENKVEFFQVSLKDDYEKKVYSMYTGTSQIAYKFGLNSFMYDKILKQFQLNNYSQYDFCGMNIPSVSKFKADFGGDLQVYYKIHKNL